MSNDIKELLKINSKNIMPELWDRIEIRLQGRKSRKPMMFLSVVAIIAVVFTMGVIKKNNILDNNALGQQSVEKNETVVLKDLTIKEILSDKFITSGYLDNIENSYTKVQEINIDKESSSIIYGKVMKVTSFVEGNLICSNIEIEVIEDYKNNILKDEKILLESRGGELTLQEYIKNASQVVISRNEYDKVEDKSKKIVTLDEGVPQYREGEYVLVYIFKLDKEEYYSEKEGRFIQPRMAEYGEYSKLYVNPNTEEVYKYIYDSTTEELVKERVGTLESFENHN